MGDVQAASPQFYPVFARCRTVSREAHVPRSSSALELCLRALDIGLSEAKVRGHRPVEAAPGDALWPTHRLSAHEYENHHEAVKIVVERGVGRPPRPDLVSWGAGLGAQY